jgi:hypothetical protein
MNHRDRSAQKESLGLATPGTPKGDLSAHQILSSRPRCEQELVYALASLLQAAESVISSTHSPSLDSLHFYSVKTLARRWGSRSAV